MSYSARTNSILSIQRPRIADLPDFLSKRPGPIQKYSSELGVQVQASYHRYAFGTASVRSWISPRPFFATGS